MTPIQEVFLEIDYDAASMARSKRDERMIEMQAQGFVCTPENLYTVDGYRVFVLVATLPEPESSERHEVSRNSNRSRPERPRPDHPRSERLYNDRSSGHHLRPARRESRSDSTRPRILPKFEIR